MQLLYSIILGIFICSSSIGGVGVYEDTTSTDDETAFEELFVHEQSIPIDGTEEHPIFGIRDLAFQDGRLAVVDAMSHSLFLYDGSGELLFRIGQAGQGPGDLQDPYWVGFRNNGDIAVKEPMVNRRFQFFSREDGEHLGGFSEGVAGGRDAFFVGEGENEKIRFTTRIGCEDGEVQSDDPLSERCLVQTVDVSTGESVSRVARINEVHPDIVGNPWLLSMDEDNNLYITHENGAPVLAIFDQNGNRIERFELDVAPQIASLDYPSLNRDVEQVFEAIHSTAFTRFFGVYPVGGHIILEHDWHGGENNRNRHLSIFSTEGEFITSTPPIDYQLHYHDGDRFFFVENVDPESDLGEYVVHEYRYVGS